MRWLSAVRKPPFAAGTVPGWRAWSLTVHDGAPSLSSLTKPARWEPGEPYRATCDRRRHEPPRRTCSCGVYAGAGPEDLARLGKIAGAVVGQVSLWGRVVEHSHGARASFAYPARLRLVCVTCLADGRGTPAARVATDGSTGRERLVPLCEEHAEDRALPAAIDVERSLLATYQVERLPDEALDRIHDDRTEPPPARRASLALLAAIVILLAVGIARGTATYERRPTPVNVVAGPVSAARDTSGSYLPIQRRNNGVESPIWSRVLLLSPRSFDEPRCGKRTADGVRHVGCKDPAANVFIGAVIRRADASGACPPETTVASRSGARTLCWRPLPTGGAGSGRTFLS